MKDSLIHQRSIILVAGTLNRKPYELIKVNLHWHPYKIEHTPFLLATNIEVYGYSSILLEMGMDEVRVVDIIGTEYIKSIEIFNPLDLKNYKYVK